MPISAREREKLTRALSMAGFPRRDALSLFLSCKLVCALVVGGIGALCAPMIGSYATFVPPGVVIVFAGLGGAGHRRHPAGVRRAHTRYPA